MTNVSKNMLFAFLVAVSATMLSLGAFATTVHADDWYDAGSFDGGSWYDAGSYGGDFYDSGSYDSGWYDSGSYGGDWYETTNNDWYDAGSYNPGWYETDTYNPGYDVADSYNPGYYETDSYNPGYYETDSYNPGYYDVDSYEAGYVEQYMEQYAAGNPIMGGGSYGSMGGGFSFPGFSSTGGCVSCHTQIPPTPTCTRNCYPTPTPTCTHNCYPTPTPTCTTCGGSNVTNVNTNVNTNTNTYIDNSINGSFNTNISNSGNTTILAPVVPQQPIVYQPQTAAPFCVITLTNAGQYSAQATLVWSSSNATSAYISQIGAVAPNGTRYVTGYANQIYSLTVTGQGGTYTCQTQMYTPTYVPPAPITPSVSLEQIPYTGLALGPVAQMIYWLSLFSVAAAGAYLVVYYKGGALALMGASMTRKQNHFVVSEQETEEVSAPAVTEVAEEVVATPVADLFHSLPTMAETKTRDVMQVIRNASGVPQIVINRA
jgi:hypothetical protein